MLNLINYQIFNINNKYYKKLKNFNFYSYIPNQRRKTMTNNYKNFNWSVFLYGIIFGIIITILLIMLFTNVVNKKANTKKNHNINNSANKKQTYNNKYTKFNDNTQPTALNHNNNNNSNNNNSNNNNNNYDFYNLLTNTQIDNNQKHNVQTNNKYILEVGKFNKASEADEFKAKLALIGFESKIQIINSKNQLKFFKLIIGPFDSQATAIAQKNNLALHGIRNVLIKNL